MISGSEVIDPCPISVAADRMVIVPSGAMLTQGVSAWPALSAAITAALTGWPAANAKESPAAPIITWRRESATWCILLCAFMDQPSRAARSTARTMR